MSSPETSPRSKDRHPGKQREELDNAKIDFEERGGESKSRYTSIHESLRRLSREEGKSTKKVAHVNKGSRGKKQTSAHLQDSRFKREKRPRKKRGNATGISCCQ